MTINWFIPPFLRGSGGHVTIFRIIRSLEQSGFECRIIIFAPRHSSPEEERQTINQWFFNLEAPVYFLGKPIPAAHVSVATSWSTAYAVRNFRATRHRCYFVQDFEPWFYSVGSESAFAEDTYRFGFTGITAGSWLQEKLRAEYGMTSHAISFSCDHSHYWPMPRREDGRRRLFFYARPPTQRRAFELGMLVISEVVRELPDVEVLFAGWDVSGYEIPFRHVNAGILEPEELAHSFRQCDAALVLSMSNLSLLPLELMACGTPVVCNRAPWTEWLLHDGIAKLAAPTVEALREALIEVLESEAERERLRSAGIAAARSTDWGREAMKVAKVLRSLGL